LHKDWHTTQSQTCHQTLPPYYPHDIPPAAGHTASVEADSPDPAAAHNTLLHTAAAGEEATHKTVLAAAVAADSILGLDPVAEGGSRLGAVCRNSRLLHRETRCGCALGRRVVDRPGCVRWEYATADGDIRILEPLRTLK